MAGWRMEVNFSSRYKTLSSTLSCAFRQFTAILAAVHAVSKQKCRRVAGLQDDMQTVLPSEFKRGMVLLVEGAPQVLEQFHTSGTAQTKHKLHCRLRHLITGRIVERIFPENERVPVAELNTRRVTFSYQQGDTFTFLDAETYDELNLTAGQVGGRRGFLKENEEYKAIFLEGKLVDIVMPPQVPLKVIETAAATKGGSDSAWKEAKLETGLEIMVPLFIEQGETVRVDTQERKYVGKETAQK